MTNTIPNHLPTMKSRIGEIVENSVEYAKMVSKLTTAGWEKCGKSEELFLADPYYTPYGAQLFFMKDNKLHGVSLSLNIREGYGESNIAIVTEADLTDAKSKSSSYCTDINAITADTVNDLIAKYKSVDVVEICIEDKEDDIEYFMGLSCDMRAEFQSRSDDDRQKPYHETVRLYHLSDCAYSISNKPTQGE